MSTFGLTAQGFFKKRYEDIEKELQDALRAIDSELNLAPDSVASKIIASFTLPLSGAWDALQALFSSQLSDAAEVINLDGVVALIGVSRLGASESTAWVIAVGDPNTVLPVGRVVSVVESGERFDSLAAVTIPLTLTAVAYVRAIVSAPTASQTYEFYIYSPVVVTIPFSTGLSPTPQTVAAAFVAAVNANAVALTVVVPFSNPDGSFGVRIIDPDVPVTVAIDATPDTLTVQAHGAVLRMEAENVGPIAAAANQLSVIETPVSGWQSVFNPFDAELGRNIETDAELRARREQSLQGAGFSVVEAIRARLLQDVDSVTAAIVIENELDVTDSATPVGRPPHSFEAVVQGGDDTAVAQRLWEVKPAGIRPVSSQNVGPYKVSENIIDTMGISHLIEFSRPVVVPVFCRVTVMLHPEELALVPVDYIDAIKNVVVAFGDALLIGVDVLPGRIEKTIFDSILGLYAVTVEVSTSAIGGVITKARTLPLSIGSGSIADFDVATTAVVTVTNIADTDY